MRFLLLAVLVVFMSGCDAPAGPPGKTKISARYQAFEVPEYGLVCVSGGSAQLSCVKR